MTVSQKASLSLLISVFLFAIFTVVSFVGLFDLVETRFYNPSITKNVSRELEEDTKIIQDYINELEDLFSTTLENESVKRSFLPNQSAEDIFERTRLFGTLMESLGGLQSIRFIDAAGRRIHYSTLPSDLFYQDRLSISYRNYNEETEPFSYSDISVSNEDGTKLTLDSLQDRILFSLPFYDSYNIFRGTALFSLSVRAISDRLLSEGLIKYGEDVSVVSDLSSGVVIGMPRTGKESLMNAVIVIWNEGITSLTPLDSETGDLSFALISSKTDQGIFTGKVVDETLFDFPFAMKIILLASFFLTTYLIIFLLFNLKQDSMTVIQNRLKRLQINLFEEYYERKGNFDWAKWSKELELRREEVRNELKRGIKIKPSSRNNLDIDTLIDKSWNEMAAVMSAQGQPQVTASIDEDKLSSILNRVLAAAGNLPSAAVPTAESSLPIQTVDKKESAAVSEDVEELEELDDVEEFESLDEVEELEELCDDDEVISIVEGEETFAEDEPLAESEELEELEELDDDEVVSVVEDEESFADVEPLAESEELEELEELGDDDEVISVVEDEEPFTDVEPLTENEDLDKLEELDDVEDAISAAGTDDSLEEFESPIEDDSLNNPTQQTESMTLLKELEGIISFVDEDESEPEENIEFDSVQKTMPLSEEDISRLASEIEFSDIDEQDVDLEHPLEIYSPFDNIILNTEDIIEDEERDQQSALEEINSSYNMSLVYNPFQADTRDIIPELESIDSDENAENADEVEEIPEEIVNISVGSASDDVIIEERNGVSYITDFDINPNAKNIDSVFMDLVDSVLRNKDE